MNIATIPFLAVAYLATTFVLSALIVRFLPDSITAIQIRMRLALFLLLPIFLVADLMRAVGAIVQSMGKMLRNGFELISGRKLYQRNQAYKVVPRRDQRTVSKKENTDAETSTANLTEEPSHNRAA